MLLHIGENISVPLERLLFIVNGRNMLPPTSAFVEKAKKERRYHGCTGQPKAYAVVQERGREVIYASMIAPSTLQKRWRDEIERRYLSDVAVVTMELDGLEV